MKWSHRPTQECPCRSWPRVSLPPASVRLNPSHLSATIRLAQQRAAPEFSQRLEVLGHSLHKFADVRPIGVALRPSEAHPAEAETQIVHERELMGLVRENWVSAKNGSSIPYGLPPLMSALCR